MIYLLTGILIKLKLSVNEKLRVTIKIGVLELGKIILYSKWIGIKLNHLI